MATREEIEALLRDVRENIKPPEQVASQVDVLPEQEIKAAVNAVPSGLHFHEKVNNAFNSAIKAGIDFPLGFVEAYANLRTVVQRGAHKALGTREVAQEAFWSRQVIDKTREFAEKNFPTHPELVDDFLTTQLPGMFVQTAGFIGGGGVVKMALQKGLKRAVSGTAVVAGMGATVGFNEFFEDAKAHGADVGDAFAAGIAGTLTGLTEAVPVGKFLGRVFGNLPKQAKRDFLEYFKNITKESAEEAIQEAFQGVSQNVTAQQIGYDPERGTLEGVPEGAGGGAIVGAVFSALSQAYGGKRLRAAQRRAGTADQPQEGTQEQPEGDRGKTLGGEPIEEIGIDPETAELPPLPEGEQPTEGTTDETTQRIGTDASKDVREGQHVERSGVTQDDEESRATAEQAPQGEVQGERERSSTVDAPPLSERIGQVPESKRIDSKRTQELIELAQSKREPTSGVEVADPNASVDLPPTPGSTLVLAINPSTQETFPLRFDGYLDQRKFVSAKELQTLAERGVSPIEESLTAGKPIPSLTQEGVFVADAGTEGIKITDLEAHGYVVEGVPTFGEFESARLGQTSVNRFSGVSASDVASGAFQITKDDPGVSSSEIGASEVGAPPEVPPFVKARANPHIREKTTAYKNIIADPRFKEENPEVWRLLDEGTYTPRTHKEGQFVGRAVADLFEHDTQRATATLLNPSNGFMDGMPEYMRYYALSEVAKDIRLLQKSVTDPVRIRDLNDQNSAIFEFLQQEASRRGQDLRFVALVQENFSPLFWAGTMLDKVTKGKRKLITQETVGRIKEAYDSASDATEVTKDDIAKKIQNPKKRRPKKC